MGINYFDIAAIVFAIIFVIVGMSRGFLRELGKLLTWVGSFVAAKILSVMAEPTVYEYLGIDTKLRESIVSLVEKVDLSSVESARATLEASIEEISVVGPLLNDFVEENWNITNIVQKASENIRTELADYILESVQPVAHDIVEIGCFVAIFIIALIVLGFVIGLVVKGLTSIKIIGGTDKLLGGVLGLAKGVLFVFILYSLLFLVLSLTGSDYLSLLMESKFFDIVLGIKETLPIA